MRTRRVPRSSEVDDRAKVRTDSVDSGSVNPTRRSEGLDAGKPSVRSEHWDFPIFDGTWFEHDRWVYGVR